MPPPGPSARTFSSSARAKSRFGASSSKNSSVWRAEMSTSSNTSNSRSGHSFKNRDSSSSRTGHSSNVSSNSDAHKPRRKRRPKKKKQQAWWTVSLQLVCFGMKYDRTSPFIFLHSLYIILIHPVCCLLAHRHEFIQWTWCDADAHVFSL